MATTEYVLDSLTEMDHYVRLMAAATGPAGIVDAVNGYLAGWSKERILCIQKVDAGWAPFDERQRPVAMYGVFDLLQFCESVRSQCVALKESGMALTPELLELDLFFFFARQIVEDHEPASLRAFPGIPSALHDAYGRGSGGRTAGSRF